MYGLSFDAVRGFRRPVYAVAAGRLLNVFGSGLVYPFATVHFHLEVGIPLALVGLGLGANNVALAVGTAIGGPLADRCGRRPVMVASMALSAFTLAAYALVQSAPEFLAVATAAGFTAGLYAPASQAVVADLTDSGERERGYGLLKVASNAGFGSGFVVGGLLYEVASVAIFVVDGVSSAAVAVLLWVALPRVRGTAPSVSVADAVDTWRRVVTERRVLALGVVNVGFAVMYAQMNATVPVVAKETLGLTPAQLGSLYVLNPLVIVLFQLPVVDAVGGWRRTRGLVFSLGFWVASLFAVWLAGATTGRLGVALVGGFLVLRTVGELLHAPLVSALASDLGGGGDRGSQLSVVEVAKRVGFGVGAAVGGAFFDAGLSDLLWPVLVAACGLLAVGLFAFERLLTPAENGARSVDSTTQ